MNVQLQRKTDPDGRRRNSVVVMLTFQLSRKAKNVRVTFRLRATGAWVGGLAGLTALVAKLLFL